MKLTTLDNRWLLRGLIIGEADTEPFMGKLAVACVVRNRVQDRRWPNSYKDVILQDAQFSCFNGIPRNQDLPVYWIHRFFTCYRDYLWWRECDYAAWGILTDYVGDITNGANHYYADKLIDTPVWAEDTQPVLQVGGHSFYKL